MRNVKIKNTAFSIILSFCCFQLSAQDYHQFGNEYININKTGMYILGSWSAVNIISGGIGWAATTGERRYFHQMNLMWNTVNAGIVIGALITMGNNDFSTMSNDELLKDQLKAENLFLINAGLDLLYIGGGLYLKNLAERRESRRDRFKGYGNSVILQGGFLLVFDGIFYALQRSHRMEFLNELSISVNGVGLQLGYSF